MRQEDRRPVVLLPTNDPGQHVKVIKTRAGDLAAVVIPAPMPTGCERWIGQRDHWTRVARIAAHERGLKLRGGMCCLLWLDELSEDDQTATEQQILAAEFGWDAPWFDPLAAEQTP